MRQENKHTIVDIVLCHFRSCKGSSLSKCSRRLNPCLIYRSVHLLKANFCLITILLSMLILGCNNSHDEIQADITPELNLSGKVVFQNVPTRTVKLAEITSLNSSSSFGEAMSYVRPVWSNDGSMFAALDIVYDLEKDTSFFEMNIVEIEDESTVNWRIDNTIKLNLESTFTWSPDNKTIALLDKSANTIIYLNTQTGDTTKTRFALELNQWITALGWHPELNKIAINIITWHNFVTDNEIWLTDPKTTELTNRIAMISGLYQIEHLDLNNEGTEFLLSGSSYNDIYSFNINTGVNKQIPNIYGLCPCWSPDGNYILYTGVSGVSGSTLIPGLFVTDIEGTFEKELLKNAGYSDWY